MLRPATDDDAAAFAAIYNYYILNTAVTFEEAPVDAATMAARRREVAGLPWLTLEVGGEIIGYAYGHPFHQRSAYRFTVENAIYLRADCARRGYGSELLRGWLAALPPAIHAVIACLGLPNPASARLHEKFGFQKTGYFPAVGYKFGAWQDVGYWQLTR
ncbi:MAG: GNAT family N-acetyltransferase [Planctomycetota bacterium]|jgi:phosphinothricin acetyltransferase|nr:GNAT family N-acetyltransferase [Planctomycetota bacterium]